MTKILGIAVLAICSNAFAKGAAGGDWDEKAAGELKSTLQKAYEGFAKGDAKPILDNVADNIWGSWGYDMANQPNQQKSKAELAKFFDEAFGMMKKMGATVAIANVKIDCHVSGSLGVCLAESDQTMTMPKMPPMTVSLRSNETFAKEKGAWKWIHHHESVAKNPPFPPKSVGWTPKTPGGTWMEAGPDMPGVKMMPLWMNPANMYSAAVMKATQTVKQPRHIHPYPFTFTVLEGTIVTSDENGKDHEYGPGSVVYRAPGEPHQTTIKQGAVVFGVAAGPMMTIPVDEKGQPVKQASN
jgi:ketosteroid isomerase-like protein